ncbi:MAG TPA: hypothetical protein VIV58_34805 [Kofleriaceae bacterium]
MKALGLLAVAAACSRSHGPPSCTVELTGNYRETSTSAQNCPTVALGAGASAGDTLLHFKIPSRALHAAYAIDLDLGRTPTPGAFNSSTTELWSAVATKLVSPGGACVIQASNNTTPTGDFALELATIDRATAHGVLAVRMFVLPRTSDDGVQTECGAGTTEQLHVRF